MNTLQFLLIFSLGLCSGGFLTTVILVGWLRGEHPDIAAEIDRRIVEG